MRTPFLACLAIAACLALSAPAKAACNGAFVQDAAGNLTFIPNGAPQTLSVAGNGFQVGLGVAPLGAGVFNLSTGAGNANVNIGVGFGGFRRGVLLGGRRGRGRR